MEEYLNKLRDQSDRTKKIIVWTVVVIVGAILVFWWMNNWKTKLEKLNTGQTEYFNGAALEEIINRAIQ